MRWLDPVDCLAARECTQGGNALEGARLLLESPQRNHRAARELLLEISAELTKQAAEAYQRGDVVVARETIHCAQQCAELQGEAAVLLNKIAEDWKEMEKRQDWHKKRLDQARAWAKEGRVRSAIGLLRPLTAEADAERLRLDLEEKLSRFERYVEQCREHLDRDELAAARERLTMARAINSSDPRVVQLEKALREAQPTELTSAGTGQPPRPIKDRSVSFALAGHALVVSQHDVVVGSPRGESVHVPIQARIHGRHALIVRDRGQYRLAPYSGCEVLVNNDSVTGPQELRDGDCLEFGGPHCRWVFRLPVAESTTAVLDQATPASACVRTPDGSQFRRVLLAGDTFDVRRQHPAHLVMPDLPCDGLTFSWSRSGLVVESQGGRTFLEAEGHEADSPVLSMLVPCRLVVYSERGEAQWLSRVLAGHDVPDALHLSIRDPLRQGTAL